MSWLGSCQDFGTIYINNPSARLKSSKAPTPSKVRVKRKVEEKTVHQEAEKASGENFIEKLPFKLNPFAKILVVGGYVEADVEYLPDVTFEKINAAVIINGMEGVLAVSTSCEQPVLGKAKPVSAERIEFEAHYPSLRKLIESPLKASFNANIHLPETELPALGIFLPSDKKFPRFLEGTAALKLEATRRDSASVKLKGAFESKNVLLESSALGEEKLKWDSATLDLDLAVDSTIAQINKLEFISPFIKLEASGKLEYEKLQDSSDSTINAFGKIDLASIAQQIPRTLKIKENTVLKSGKLDFELEATTIENGIMVFSILRTDGLETSVDGKAYAIYLPLSLVIKSNLSPNYELDKSMLVFKSTPVTLEAAGNLENGEILGSINMEEIYTILQQVLDLENKPQIHGNFRVKGGWKKISEIFQLKTIADGTNVKIITDKSLNLDTCSIKLLSSFQPSDAHLLKNLEFTIDTPFANAEIVVDTNFDVSKVPEQSAGNPVNLFGKADVDFDKAQSLLEELGLNEVLASGKSSTMFKLSLPADANKETIAADANVEADFTAPSLTSKGLAIRDAAASLSATNGTTIIDVWGTVNEGKLKIVPSINLLDTPPVLTLPDNSVVLKDAEITQEFLENYLTRVHPVLGSSAIVSGNISIIANNLKIPLHADALTEMDWTVSANLRDTHLTASGILLDIVNTLGLKNRDIIITNQTINVACHGGRFYPDPLDISVDNEKLCAYGSVGVDGTLDYKIDVELSEKILGSSVYKYIKDEVISLPVSGTVSRPSINSRAMREQIQRIIKNAASEISTEKLEEKLSDKLEGKIKEKDFKKIEDVLKKLRK
ncbi:MAG: hypothetical protein GX804_04070 [Lentisphaerae bacterium]|nr:hypothetical protein [Lentisphaerota bacterium]